MIDVNILNKPISKEPNYFNVYNTIETRKQKQLMRQNQDILNGITDDFDQLTKNVNIKKWKEYMRKKNEEIKRNA